MEQGPRVFAKAICNNCGGEVFDIALIDNGETIILCLKCRTVWEDWPPKTGTEGQDLGGHQTMVEAGDEPKDMVSTAEGGPTEVDITTLPPSPTPGIP